MKRSGSVKRAERATRLTDPDLFTPNTAQARCRTCSPLQPSSRRSACAHVSLLPPGWAGTDQPKDVKTSTPGTARSAVRARGDPWTRDAHDRLRLAGAGF